MSEWRWFTSTKKKECYKNSQCFKLPIPTVRNIIRNEKINEVEVKARSGRSIKISDRMAWDLVRNAQKNPRITAKELQKRVADTGLCVCYYLNIKDLCGRVARKNNLNKKWSIWSMQKKTLRSLEPFGTMCFGLTKPKLNLLATTKEGTVMVKNTGTPALLSDNAPLLPENCCDYKCFDVHMFIYPPKMDWTKWLAPFQNCKK